MASTSFILRTASKSNCPEAIFFGTTFHVARLRERDATRLQLFFGCGAHGSRCHLAQALPHAIPYGRLSCGRDLLTDNLMHDRREQIVLVHFPAHNAHRIDRGTELFVFRLEVFNGVGAIFEIARQRSTSLQLGECGLGRAPLGPSFCRALSSLNQVLPRPTGFSIRPRWTPTKVPAESLPGSLMVFYWASSATSKRRSKPYEPSLSLFLETSLWSPCRNPLSKRLLKFLSRPLSKLRRRHH